MNIIDSLVKERGALVLDGALATELEGMGCDLNHALWSADVLLHAPECITAVHRSYLEAGCDIISSASYQASIAGFIAEGQTHQAAKELFQESIQLAGRERDDFVKSKGLVDTRRPLVAASLGPYGAYLADGSEYSGGYSISNLELERFHAERLELVAGEVQAGHADLIALETIPSLGEAHILARQLDTLKVPGWISFACRDGTSTCEGQDILDAARMLNEHEFVVGIGVNCTPPEWITPLLKRLATATAKALLAYPNSGETYDAETRSWSGKNVLTEIDSSVAHWSQAGATLLGGCCRTTPADMARIATWRDHQNSL